MRIAALITAGLAVLLWILCAIGWGGSKSMYLLAYLLKYPAVLFSAISLILFIIVAFKR